MNMVRILIVLLLQSLISGCSDTVDKSLVEYIKKLKSQKSEVINTIPKPPPMIVFRYSASNLRDPFEPFFSATSATSRRYPGEGPELNRKREPLEAFSLDTLQMVGTLERDGVFFGLIRDSSGMIYRVSIGNYVGTNAGKIVRISASEIELKEWLSDGKDGWREHKAIISFAKTKKDK
jgi:type IV pilus assembly protein PilP